MTRHATAEELHAITRFLYEEAELLDNRKYQEWLDLFTPEFSYEAPLRFHRWQEGVKDDWATEKEIGGTGSIPVTRQNRMTFQIGLDRIRTGLTVNYNPPWFTERVITNIIADHDGEDFRVRSKFIIYRFKSGEEQIIPGHRHDVLVRTDDTFRIRERKVVTCTDSYLWGDYCII